MNPATAPPGKDSSPPTRSILGQSRGHSSIDERAEQIIKTATRLFSERGYSATRLNDIALELGVTRAALYYYFSRGKVEILDAVCSAGMDRAERVYERAALEPDAVNALVTFITDYAAHITTGEARVFFREAAELDADVHEQLTLRARRLTGSVVDLLHRGIEEGAFRADIDPELAANGLFGTLNWMSQWHSSGDGRVTARELGERFAQLFLRGVQA